MLPLFPAIPWTRVNPLEEGSAICWAGCSAVDPQSPAVAESGGVVPASLTHAWRRTPDRWFDGRRQETSTAFTADKVKGLARSLRRRRSPRQATMLIARPAAEICLTGNELELGAIPLRWDDP